jgi:hypothetical protein
VQEHFGIGVHITKPVYPEPTHDNGWRCVDGMIEPKWVSGDFIPQQLADVLVEENIAGKFLIFQNFYKIFLIGQVKLLYGNFYPNNIVLSEC